MCLHREGKTKTTITAWLFMLHPAIIHHHVIRSWQQFHTIILGKCSCKANMVEVYASPGDEGAADGLWVGDKMSKKYDLLAAGGTCQLYGEEDGVVLSPSPPCDDKKKKPRKNSLRQQKSEKKLIIPSFISDELFTWVSPSNTQENTWQLNVAAFMIMLPLLGFLTILLHSSSG